MTFSIIWRLESIRFLVLVLHSRHIWKPKRAKRAPITEANVTQTSTSWRSNFLLEASWAFWCTRTSLALGHSSVNLLRFLQERLNFLSIWMGDLVGQHLGVQKGFRIIHYIKVDEICLFCALPYNFYYFCADIQKKEYKTWSMKNWSVCIFFASISFYYQTFKEPLIFLLRNCWCICRKKERKKFCNVCQKQKRPFPHLCTSKMWWWFISKKAF